MTLGSVAAAHLTLIVWCRDRRHQVEPNPEGRIEVIGRICCSQCSEYLELVFVHTRFKWC